VVKKILRSMVAAVTLVVIGTAIFASSASASGWTVLGGDPLFPGGIPNANQQGRNKFVHDMLSHKGVLAQKRAGLNQRERQAFKQALVRGEFKQCTLRYGDQFEFMSYGVGTIFVDHGVTFRDPRYKGHGAPAFCLTAEVGKSGEVIELKIPFKCENFGGNRKKLKPKAEKPEKPKRHKPKPKPRPKTETPQAPPATTPPVTPPVAPPAEGPSIMITSVTALNMIPAGRNSGPFYIGTTASQAGGTVTIDPEIGSVSSCESSTPEDSLVLSVPAGASKQCVIIYAPEDKDEPEWMTVFLTANLGSAHEQLLEFFELQYSSRPS
jgi:hypothetical protein